MHSLQSSPQIFHFAPSLYIGKTGATATKYSIHISLAVGIKNTDTVTAGVLCLIQSSVGTFQQRNLRQAMGWPADCTDTGGDAGYRQRPTLT